MKSKTPSNDAEYASELNAISKWFDRIGSTQPKLAGVQSLLAIDQQRLARGFKDADLEILAGALYLEAIRQLKNIPLSKMSAKSRTATTRRRITEADVKAVLSKPISTRRYGHAYFYRILDDAKAKLESNPRYRRQLADAQGAVSRTTCLGGTPRWICIGMVVVVVIGVILLFV